jgi:hypothetical protein
VGIQIEVVHGDALRFRADLLALKFAQHLFGIDKKVVERLSQKDGSLSARLPSIGDTLVVRSEQIIAAREILFVGVEPLGRFDYQEIRRFARCALSTLAKEARSVSHVALTLHGVGFGLDEAEAFRSEIAGLLDAVYAGEIPPGLERISVIHNDADTVQRLIQLLRALLPDGIVNEASLAGKVTSPSLAGARAQLGAVGHDSRNKPHVFVAMPFAEEYADRFRYGIEGPVKVAGFLCERADLASFTGDVVAWVKERIGSAALVIADLTTANPNVYLEVGYAWGKGVNTVLVVAKGDELKFDVRSQRCLVFKNIQHLEELLTQELKALRSSNL